jgi:hypothetical protein
MVVRQEDWAGGNDDVLALVGPLGTEAAGRTALEAMPADLPAPPSRHERLSLMRVTPA